MTNNLVIGYQIRSPHWSLNKLSKLFNLKNIGCQNLELRNPSWLKNLHFYMLIKNKLWCFFLISYKNLFITIQFLVIATRGDNQQNLSSIAF